MITVYIIIFIVIIMRLTFLLGVGFGSVLKELRRLGKCAQ